MTWRELALLVAFCVCLGAMHLGIYAAWRQAEDQIAAPTPPAVAGPSDLCLEYARVGDRYGGC